MDINIPSNVQSVLDRLEYCGFEGYIVGGCVRDAVMGITPKDYDVTTNALPEQIIECFAGDHRVIETGIKHGTVTVVSEGENVEITTYRVDGKYCDHRRPESVSFTVNLEDDLSRRDFTVNAMAYSHKTGIIDKFGGQKDLFNHIIRCVGDPCQRFEEDTLRILRALRFASRLNFTIERETAAAIHQKEALLREISVERISSELVGILTGDHPCELMLAFDDVFTRIIPELLKCVDFDQKSRYHIYDVWEHTAHAVEYSRNDKNVRLALLFHDIEKPSCFKKDEEGQGHFPDHEKKGAETAECIMRRMHFDNDTIKKVTALIKYHYVTPIDDKRVVKRLISVLGNDVFMLLTEVMKGDSRAKQAFCLERLPILDAMKLRAYEIADAGECCSLRQLEVNGKDIENAGATGKQVGKILEQLLTDVIDEKLPNEKAVLMKAVSQMINQTFINSSF